MAVKMKWVSDIDRTVLVSNFERLGWVRGTTEGREGELRRIYPDTIVSPVKVQEFYKYIASFSSL